MCPKNIVSIVCFTWNKPKIVMEESKSVTRHLKYTRQNEKQSQMRRGVGSNRRAKSTRISQLSFSRRSLKTMERNKCIPFLRSMGKMRKWWFFLKRDKRGKMYDFSRFNNVLDEKVFSATLDNIIIGSRKIYVNIPRYKRRNYEVKEIINERNQNNQIRISKVLGQTSRSDKTPQEKIPEYARRGQWSYAKVLGNNHNQRKPYVRKTRKLKHPLHTESLISRKMIW